MKNPKIKNLEEITQKHKEKYLSKNFKARVIKDEPYIVKINNFFSKEEIKEILELTRGKFEKSNIVIDGKLVEDTKQRNSSTAYIFDDGMPKKYSDNIEKIIKKICYLTDCNRKQIEMMAVRYKKGEYFGKHVDYFREDEVGVLDDGGQRIMTFFVYLNTLEKGEGGETEFTKLGIKSRPKKGDALFWYNQNPITQKMLSLTEHQGNAVIGDTVKYAVNIWIRSENFY